MKILFTFIALLYSHALFAQAEGEGWYKQKSGTTARLDRVYFFNQDSGWAVGSGVWYKTTNGGNTWEFVPLPEHYSPANMIDFNTAFVIHEKYIKLTTDAGVTWSDTINTGVAHSTAWPLYAFNKDTIFTFSGRDEWSRTTDRGKTWIRTRALIPGVDEVHRVFFENSKVGYATGDLSHCVPPPFPVSSGIAKTTDGGKSWNPICTENKIEYPVEDLYGIWAKDEFIILAGAEGAIAISRNGGNNWDTIRAEGETTPFKRLFTGVQFTSSSIGYIIGAPGCILKTIDSGHTWQVQKSTVAKDIDTNVNIFLYDVAFVNSEIGWVVGRDGIILHTMNGGMTWVKQNLPQPLTTSVNPEPFGTRTSITYELPKASKVVIRIYDALGREIEVIDSDGILESGTHSIEFDGSKYPEGMFYYCIETDAFVGTGKMTKVVY